MLAWMKRRAPAVHNKAEVEVSAAIGKRSVMSGKYLGLYKYLENRYANTVVLTFAQIEDLLGFALPNEARVEREWWANRAPTGTSSSQAGSCTLASRTAEPNLAAQIVVFERAQT